MIFSVRVQILPSDHVAF